MVNERIAIIDLGTNTFNLLITDLATPKTYTVVYNSKISVKLGKGGISKNILLADAIERGINALAECLNLVKSYKAEKVYAFATSAIREASNKETFLEKASALGLKVVILSGDREAELIYKGVRLGLDIGDLPSLIMDIGGGSTEFIIANSSQVFWKQSFLLGVARLQENFKHSDPVTKQEVSDLEMHLIEKLEPLFKAVKQYPVKELIGSSGSFDSFEEILSQRSQKPKRIKARAGYHFGMQELNILFNELILSDRDQRLAIKGLIEMRVDMIVLSVVLTRCVLKNLQLKNVRHSSYALKEGVLSELMENRF